MFEKIEEKQKSIILELINKISPHGKDYVKSAFEKDNIEVFYFNKEGDNIGVFLVVKGEESNIFFSSFVNESYSSDMVNLSKEKLQDYIINQSNKELCFNIYGKNRRLIELAKFLGFTKDMEGSHMKYNSDIPSPLLENNLVIKDFNDDWIDDFCDLFDKGYYNLQIENGWETNYYSNHKEGFKKTLNRMKELEQIFSFWKEGKLMGAYIIDGNYISDLVVHPDYQNKGYGSFILNHCIRHMMINKNIKDICLRVATSNTGAKRLYERNDFIEIAWFAEHTYPNI